MSQIKDFHRPMHRIYAGLRAALLGCSLSLGVAASVIAPLAHADDAAAVAGGSTLLVRNATVYGMARGATEPLKATDVMIENGRITKREVPLRNALNEVLRDEYVADCERAVRKWNRTIAAAGVSFELKLPSRRFNRSMGHSSMRLAMAIVSLGSSVMRY